jgi:hypothetical protein
MNERRLLIGLITSTEFIQNIQGAFNVLLIESPTAKRIATWCIEYFRKYNKAPGREIEAIFYEKLKKGLPKDIAEEIEQEILSSLNDEYVNEQFNVDHLTHQALEYLSERHHLKHSEEVIGLIKVGKLIEAEKLQNNFKPLPKNVSTGIDLSDKSVLKKIDKAFNNTSECLIKYPGAYGKFMNPQLVRGGFVAFLAHEKMGKTWKLIEKAIRAASQKRRVAYFSAGDMNEDQLIKRVCINRARKSDREEYSGKMFEPVKDCILNQNDSCERTERESSFGIFEGKPAELLRKEVNLPDLIEAYKKNKGYVECHNCRLYSANNKLGVPWIKKINVGDPLTAQEAKRVMKNFFIKYKRQFKISCHPSGTLTVAKALAIMDIWEKDEGFIPDVVFFDYPDIMNDENERDFRAKQNKIWMDMRGVSDIRHCLTIAVTQADADSYTKDLLKLQNFSEDKRKYSHVTAFYGLNQDHTGREKALGIMRINELLLREGDFSVGNQVYVLQNLRRGLPFLTSYW